MRIIAVREFNGICWYGYAYNDNDTPYWSIKLYRDAWHPLGLFV